MIDNLPNKLSFEHQSSKNPKIDFSVSKAKNPQHTFLTQYCCDYTSLCMMLPFAEDLKIKCYSFLIVNSNWFVCRVVDPDVDDLSSLTQTQLSSLCPGPTEVRPSASHLLSFGGFSFCSLYWLCVFRDVRGNWISTTLTLIRNLKFESIFRDNFHKASDSLKMISKLCGHQLQTPSLCFSSIL